MIDFGLPTGSRGSSEERSKEGEKEFGEKGLKKKKNRFLQTRKEDKSTSDARDIK